jgi:hypothetical protein
MGLISLISRLGKSDCNTPCQTIDCSPFVCDDFVSCGPDGLSLYDHAIIKVIVNSTCCSPMNDPWIFNPPHPQDNFPFCFCLFRSDLSSRSCGNQILQLRLAVIAPDCANELMDLPGGIDPLPDWQIQVSIGFDSDIQPNDVFEATGLANVQKLCRCEPIQLTWVGTQFGRGDTRFGTGACTRAASITVQAVYPGCEEEPPPPICIPPTVSFASTPPANTTDTTATFTWNTTGTVGATLLTLDGGTPTAPISPGIQSYQNLAPGLHTLNLEVLSLGGCGNASVSYNWTVDGDPPPDCIPPTVAFTLTPPTQTESTTATFNWSTTGTVAQTIIKLDDLPPTNPLGSNTHTYSNLVVGTHTVFVEVQAPCGSHVIRWDWTITEAPPPCVTPTVTITQGPPNPTEQTSATFNWTTTGTVAQVLVRLDGGAFVNPSGNNTHSLSNLPPGLHIFEVKADSLACGAASAFHQWQINAPCVPPQVAFTQTPPVTTPNTNATFAWSASGTVATTTIQIDGGALLTPSGNTHTFTNLTPGFHTVFVTVASQCGSHVIRWDWEITAATTLCEKVNSLFQLIGTAEPNVDVEITFSGVFANQCGATNYNRTYLIPGPHVPTNNCPNVTVCETIVDNFGCGGISGTYTDNSWILCPNLNLIEINGLPTLAWLLCTGCTSPGISAPPMIRVRSSVPNTGSGMQFADFAASGEAQVTALVDQMLATGSCQIPFFQQVPNNPPPGTIFPTRDFRFATCTIRIL